MAHLKDQGSTCLIHLYYHQRVLQLQHHISMLTMQKFQILPLQTKFERLERTYKCCPIEQFLNLKFCDHEVSDHSEAFIIVQHIDEIQSHHPSINWIKHLHSFTVLKSQSSMKPSQNKIAVNSILEALFASPSRTISDNSTVIKQVQNPFKCIDHDCT